MQFGIPHVSKLVGFFTLHIEKIKQSAVCNFIEFIKAFFLLATVLAIARTSSRGRGILYACIRNCRVL